MTRAVQGRSTLLFGAIRKVVASESRTCPEGFAIVDGAGATPLTQQQAYPLRSQAH